MSRYVVDASVVVKWYVEEIHSADAHGLAGGGHVLIAPDLLLAEVGNVVWRKVRRAELSASEGETILHGVRSAGVQIRPSGHLLIPAYLAAVRMQRTVYDCLYLVLALQESCRLVTADRRFFDAMCAGGYAADAAWIENAS